MSLAATRALRSCLSQPSTSYRCPESSTVASGRRNRLGYRPNSLGHRSNGLGHCSITPAHSSKRANGFQCSAKRQDRAAQRNLIDDDTFWFTLGQDEDPWTGSVKGGRGDVGEGEEEEDFVEMYNSRYERKAAQTVFTPSRWQKHRSTSRYLRHIFGMFGGSTFETLFDPLALLTGNAVLLAVYQTVAENQSPLALPDWCILPVLHLGDWPVELTSFALSTLMVLRTEVSYARWQEAMDAMSDVRNVTKELVRDSAMWFDDPVLTNIVVKWTVTFSVTLEIYVTGYTEEETTLENGRRFPTKLATLLLPHEREQLLKADLRPHYALHVLTEVVKKAHINEIRESMMVSEISELGAALGTCEKLLRFPIPIGYTRHTSRFMLLWLIFLPLSLWDEFSWSMIPLTMVISFLMLGIEQIGVQIEEPFSSLPVADITSDILNDILTLTKSKKDVSGLVDTSTTTEERDPLEGRKRSRPRSKYKTIPYMGGA